MNSIQESITRYIEINKTLSSLRAQQKDLKAQSLQLEETLKKYMIDNSMDSISIKDGEVVLYTKKISQTLKKDTIVEKLAEKLNDQSKAEDLATSILQNKKYTTEESIKAIIKKKK